MKRCDLQHVLAFFCGALVAVVLMLVIVVTFANRPTPEAPAQETLPVVEEPIYKPVPAGTYMPIYMQDDTQWASVEYAGGTIADSGCGLTCAAMAIKYLTTQDVTPLALAGSVGNECLTDGVNDAEKFARWIVKAYPAYGMTCTGKLYILQSALLKVDTGAVCFAGVRGQFGDTNYNSHVVLIWRHDASGNWWVRDPASAGNSARPWTLEELQAADLFYFVCLAGGFYGTTGN